MRGVSRHGLPDTPPAISKVKNLQSEGVCLLCGWRVNPLLSPPAAKFTNKIGGNMNYSLMLSFSALLISVFTLISTARNINKPKNSKEELFFAKPKKLISNDTVTAIEAKWQEADSTLMPVGDYPPEPKPALEVTGIENLGIKKFECVPPTYLAIECGIGKELIKIYFDGRVEISDGVSLPQAAK